MKWLSSPPLRPSGKTSLSECMTFYSIRNDIVREKRGLSPEMCLRLGRLFGTTPQFWMNMQSKVDIWDSLALHEDEVMAIEPIEIAAIA